VVPAAALSSRRNGNAAKRFFRKLLKGMQYVAGVIVTDNLTLADSLTASCWPLSSIAGPGT
jgi:transposase-like protein